MPYLVRELINDAYYLSRIVSRNFQSVSGQQLTDGLRMFNDILLEKSADERHIPYFEEYQFNAVIGQEEYFVPNLISVSTVVFFLGAVRFPVRIINRNRYHGSARTDNINSLPFTCSVERAKGGSDIYFYFFPDKNYLIKLWGKFGLTEVSGPDEDLSLIYDRFYTHYLEYDLATEICNYNSVACPPNVIKKLDELTQKTLDVSPQDLSIQKISSLTGRGGLSYWDVNIGRGWRP